MPFNDTHTQTHTAAAGGRNYHGSFRVRSIGVNRVARIESASFLATCPIFFGLRLMTQLAGFNGMIVCFLLNGAHFQIHTFSRSTGETAGSVESLDQLNHWIAESL